MAKKNKAARLNLRITLEQQKRLEKLTKDSDSASMTDTVRRALAVYEHLWKARMSNQQIIIRDDEGDESDLLLL